MWTEQNDRDLTELHNKLEANGFQRSKLSLADRDHLSLLEQKWTDEYDFPPTSNPAS